MKQLFLSLIVLFSISSRAGEALPELKTRLAMFDAFVSEIEKLDAEGLPARANRPETWKVTIAKLRKDLEAAKTTSDVGRVFDRVDATYPNLHAHLTASEAYSHRTRPQFSVRFRPEVIAKNQKSYSYKISSIDGELVKGLKESVRPAIGDDLLAINGRPMSEWSRENFVFCKFPYREQCESNFFDHFRKGLLSWRPGEKFQLTVRRNGRVWTFEAPVVPPAAASAEKASSSSSSSAQDEVSECPVESDRYEGFKPVYKGFNICVFESEKNPGVAVLRLASFRYRNLPETSKFKTLRKEVGAFYDEYWKAKAPTVKKLIIDVIDNGGGDTPVGWYEVFLDKPFQEQGVEFKKIPALEIADIREVMFYGDAGKEIWFKRLNDDGSFAKIKAGGFLPEIPQFCATEDKSCEEGLFQPRPHGFKGEIRILVNEWCISSCTGFVWQLKDKLGSRVKLVGMPDSGDSAYARVYLDLYLDPSKPGGFRLEVAGRKGQTTQELPTGAILRHQVAVTRSTDMRGHVVSAKPTPVDVWVPIHYKEFDDSWEAKAFKAALAK